MNRRETLLAALRIAESDLQAVKTERVRAGHDQDGSFRDAVMRMTGRAMVLNGLVFLDQWSAFTVEEADELAAFVRDVARVETGKGAGG